MKSEKKLPPPPGFGLAGLNSWSKMVCMNCTGLKLNGCWPDDMATMVVVFGLALSVEPEFGLAFVDGLGRLASIDRFGDRSDASDLAGVL